MPLVGTPHVAKITLGCSYQPLGTDVENVFFLHDGSDAIFSDPSGVCDQVHTAAVAELVPQWWSDIELTYVKFEDVRSVPFGGLKNSYAATAGTKGSSTRGLPSDVAIAIKKTTGALGRSGRGRWFWPIGDGSSLDGNSQIDSTYLAAIEAALASFQTGVEGGTYPCEMGIVSYYTAKALRPAGVFYQITGWTHSDTVVDSQRRRLPGRGT